MTKYTVVVAESQTLFRDMITNFVEDMDEFRVIGTLKNGQEVINFIKEKEVRPYLVLLDIHMPIMDGLECARQLKNIYPNIKVVLLSAYDDEESIETVLSVAADGYILKSSGLEEFKDTLRFIIDGKFVAPPQKLVHYFSERLESLLKLERESSLHYIKEQFNNRKDLNNREWQIIQLMKKGWTNRMIAEQLGISEGTVKNYLSIIYKKLEIKNRVELLQILSDMTG
ncbi:two-component response regulator [Gracilibacillus boraciitolerans JCM 21714]|uniref:Two-component response regulator n=1 Tax=Gracilibacillus boraciitolerans JCM 21714 TaxID=1298598 RepID=W4VGJ9_9BACI|nr:response regulator transcription factor [Gracilibacillus boraciitolerans]GAE91918.1 two-component response regulator [Gracilibacillus boraciitolerans JCM 21714]